MFLITTLALAAPQTTWFVDASATAPGFGTAQSPYTRVDYAVAQSSTVDGDTVEVRPGTYPDEHVVLLGKSLTIRSRDGAAATILRGSLADPIVEDTAGGLTTIEGFTFQRGRGKLGVVQSESGGGAIAIEDTSLVIRDALFDDCHADFGGAISALSTGEVDTLTLENCTVRPSCFAKQGGSLYVVRMAVTVDGCQMHSNARLSRGGVIQAYGFDVFGSRLDVRSSGLRGSSFSGGGAMSCLTIDVTIEDSTIEGTVRSSYPGGGLSMFGGRLDVHRSTFENCSAVSGGAAYLRAGESGARFEDTVFHDNETSALSTIGAGGAVRAETVTEFERCVFLRNRAMNAVGGRGGALYGPVLVRHCTFLDNDASSDGGAIHYDGQPNLLTHVEACVLAASPSGVRPINDEARVERCVVDGGHAGAGEGNVDADPSLWGADDVHLLPDSPARDLADPAAGLDPDGTPMDAGALPFDRDWCGPGCDGAIGATSCAAVANSTGLPSTIAGLGSLVPSNDRVILNVDGLPPQSIGFFLGGQTHTFMPGAGGSFGNLCIGLPAIRFDATILRATPVGGEVSFRVRPRAPPGGRPRGGVAARSSRARPGSSSSGTGTRWAAWCRRTSRRRCGWTSSPDASTGAAPSDRDP